MRAVYLALLVGMIPTVSMGVASFFLSHVTVSGIVEACFQNFAAGLILAAVAAELFPLLLADDVSTVQSMVGITVGFAIGLLILNATEWFVDKFIDVLNRIAKQESMTYIIQSLFQPRAPVVSEQSVGIDIQQVPDTSATRKKTDISFHDIEEVGLSCELRQMRMRKDNGSDNGSSRDLLSEWVYDPVELSSVAIALPNHRLHLEEHLVEIHTDVVAMEAKSARLVGDDQLSQRDTEQIAEEIDEAIHLLQYKLDHCRRLLEGSEIEVISPASRGDGPGGPGTVMTIVRNAWVTDTKKLQIKGRMTGLRATAQHLVGHIQEQNIDEETLVEMHEHMEHFNLQLASFHEQIEVAAAKWRKSRPTTMTSTHTGDSVPYG